MNKIISEYKRLKRQLINAGEETSMDEVNDCVLESMNDILRKIAT